VYSISIFYFTFYLFGGAYGAYAPNAPPAYAGPAVHTRVAHAFLNRPLHDVDFQFPASYDHALIIHVSR